MKVVTVFSRRISSIIDGPEENAFHMTAVTSDEAQVILVAHPMGSRTGGKRYRVKFAVAESDETSSLEKLEQTDRGPLPAINQE